MLGGRRTYRTWRGARRVALVALLSFVAPIVTVSAFGASGPPAAPTCGPPCPNLDEIQQRVDIFEAAVEGDTTVLNEPAANTGDGIDDFSLSPATWCAMPYNDLADRTVVDTRRGAGATPTGTPAASGCGYPSHGGTTFYKTGGPWGGPVAGNYNHKYSNWMYWQRCD